MSVVSAWIKDEGVVFDVKGEEEDGRRLDELTAVEEGEDKDDDSIVKEFKIT